MSALLARARQGEPHEGDEEGWKAGYACAATGYSPLRYAPGILLDPFSLSTARFLPPSLLLSLNTVLFSHQLLLPLSTIPDFRNFTLNASSSPLSHLRFSLFLRLPPPFLHSGSCASRSL